MEWTPNKIERVLREILLQNSKRSYELTCRRLADELQCGENDVPVADQLVRDGDPINRLLWGLCLRVRDYRPDPDSASTWWRGGRVGPLTWAERRCLGWAVNGRSAQQKVKPSARYLSELLGRSEGVVAEEMRRVGPARGRVGFF